MKAALALPLLALVLAGCDRDATPEAPPVRPVLSVIAEPLANRGQRFVGTVEAQIKADLGFQVLGRLIARDVDVGDQVKAGQELARIDDTAYAFSVRNIEAQLSSRKAERANAVAAAERQVSLREGGVAADASLELAQQARETADAAVTKAETDLTKAREQLGYTVLKAEFDGIVTATGVDIGQVVSGGQTVLTLARPDLRDAVIDVPDWIPFEDLGLGAVVEVSLQANPAIRASGKVRQIAPQSDSATRTRRIKIGLDTPPDGFRLGATVNVTVADAAAARAPAGIGLPATAILTENGKTAVWIVDSAAGAVSRRTVEVAPAGADAATVVVRAGLAAGERVVTAGVRSLKDGQKVKIGEIVP